MLQGQIATFNIPSDTSYTGSVTVNFSGNSITSNQAWAAVQAINVSYKGGDDDHNRGVSQVIPSIGMLNGTQVDVNLTFAYTDDNCRISVNLIQGYDTH